MITMKISHRPKTEKRTAASEEGIFTTASDLFAVGVTAWSHGAERWRADQVRWKFQGQMTFKKTE